MTTIAVRRAAGSVRGACLTALLCAACTAGDITRADVATGDVDLAMAQPADFAGLDLAGRDQAKAPPDLSVVDAKAGDLASSPSDLKVTFDANWGGCNVGGVVGTCTTTANCTAAGMQATSGLCPGPSTVQCCTPKLTTDGGTHLCPSTSYPTPNDGLYGAPGEADESGGDCPLGMLRVTTFCIDRYEGSLWTIDGAGAVTGSWSPYKNPGSAKVRAASIAGAIPQGYINQPQATAACVAAGKRLCSNTEWRTACQGPDGFTYPYGNTRVDNRCNDETDRVQHPVIECFGTSDPSVWSKLGDPGISQQENTIEPSGEKAECVSPFGVNDMMGNLHEWTSDPAGTFQGGFYFDTKVNGNGCLYRTTAHDVSHWDYSTGFRCCK